MVKLKLKINVNLLQLLCVVVSVALHSEFERFGGFYGRQRGRVVRAPDLKSVGRGCKSRSDR